MATQTELAIVVKAKDEATSAMKSIGANVGGALKNIGMAAAAAGTAIAAAGAAAGAFAVSSLKDFSRVGDEVEKMSKRTGFGAEAISALRVAADMGGTSIESVETAIKKMQLSVDGLAQSSPALVSQLKNMGFTLKEIKAMAPEKQFESLGNAISKVEDPAQRTQMAVAAFGKAGTDLLPMFEDGSFSMEAWSEQAKKLGVSFDELSAAHAAQLNDAVGKLTTAWNGLKLKIGGELAPVVTAFIEGQLVPLAERTLALVPTLDEAKSAFSSVNQAFNKALADFDAKTGIVTQLRQGFDKLWNTVKTELMPALLELWDAMQPLLPVIGAIMRALAALTILGLKVAIEALIVIIDKIIRIIAVGTEFVAFVLDALGPTFDAMKQGFDGVADAIGWVIQKFAAMKQGAIDAMNAARNAMMAVPGVSAISAVLQGRAAGGPVDRGQPYVVGERGPELFVPNQDGTILPSVGRGSGAAGPSTNITISIGNFFGGDPDRAAREFGDLIIKRLQLNARVG